MNSNSFDVVGEQPKEDNLSEAAYRADVEKLAFDATVRNGALPPDPPIVVFAEARKGDAAAGGRKLDAGKIPLLQGCLAYFAPALFAVALVSEYGDRKYVPEDAAPEEHYTSNWCRVPNGFNRYGDAEARHMLQPFVKIDPGVDYAYDEESGLAHLQQEAWNALARLTRAIRDGKIELRRGNDIVAGKPVLGTARAVKL